MDFSLKRWGAHFCPPPIWAAKKAYFLPPFQVLGHVAHMFFLFLLHRFCVFLHDFCIFSHFFCQIFCLSKRKLADFGSNLLCFPMIIPCKFRIIFRPVRLKLPCTPSCMVEITQHTLLYGWNYPARPLYGWNYPARPSVWLKLPSTPSCTVEIILHALLYGWNYPARPFVRL